MKLCDTCLFDIAIFRIFMVFVCPTLSLSLSLPYLSLSVLIFVSSVHTILLVSNREMTEKAFNIYYKKKIAEKKVTDLDVV